MRSLISQWYAIIEAVDMHTTGGEGNGRPQRYLRLARMRFDSMTPSAAPAINWSVEAPFFNRFLLQQALSRDSASDHSQRRRCGQHYQQHQDTLVICALQGG
jgi:hypothetical protein